MNYFGHAAIASLKNGSPGFVLGSMLPDLGPMAGLRVPNRFADSELQAGVDFHIETDALFHQTGTFIELNREALLALRDQGVSRGPARACAHMGVEMLIDATLIEQDALREDYLRALAFGAQRADTFAPLNGVGAATLRGLCAHLLERGQAVHSTSQERFVLRLGRTLAPRRRLAPTTEELDTIANYLCRLDSVAPRVPELMNELRPLVEMQR